MLIGDSVKQLINGKVDGDKDLVNYIKQSVKIKEVGKNLIEMRHMIASTTNETFKKIDGVSGKNTAATLSDAINRLVITEEVIGLVEAAI